MMMESRVNSRKCQVNQITDGDDDDRHHYHHLHYELENAQIDSASKLKRLKTFVDNETNGNYVPQNLPLENTQIDQHSTQNCEQSNLIYVGDRGKKTSIRKDLKNGVMQDNAHNINSNDDTTIGISLAQHFNDRLQTQSIAQNYSPQCETNHNENSKTSITTYSPLPNETLNGISRQQCERSFGESYQNNE